MVGVSRALSNAFSCGLRGNQLPGSGGPCPEPHRRCVVGGEYARRCAGLVMGMFVAFGNAFLKTKRKSDSWDWAVHARSLAGAVRWRRGCRRCAGLAVGMFAACQTVSQTMRRSSFRSAASFIAMMGSAIGTCLLNKKGLSLST